jgi:hypothetical protein
MQSQNLKMHHCTGVPFNLLFGIAVIKYIVSMVSGVMEVLTNDG